MPAVGLDKNNLKVGTVSNYKPLPPQTLRTFHTKFLEPPPPNASRFFLVLLKERMKRKKRDTQKFMGAEPKNVEHETICLEQ